MNYTTYSICNLTILLCNELLLPKVLLLGIGNTLKLGRRASTSYALRVFLIYPKHSSELIASC